MTSTPTARELRTIQRLARIRRSLAQIAETNRQTLAPVVDRNGCYCWTPTGADKETKPK